MSGLGLPVISFQGQDRGRSCLNATLLLGEFQGRAARYIGEGDGKGSRREGPVEGGQNVRRASRREEGGTLSSPGQGRELPVALEGEVCHGFAGAEARTR